MDLSNCTKHRTRVINYEIKPKRIIISYELLLSLIYFFFFQILERSFLSAVVNM